MSNKQLRRILAISCPCLLVVSMATAQVSRTGAFFVSSKTSDFFAVAVDEIDPFSPDVREDVWLMVSECMAINIQGIRGIEQVEGRKVRVRLAFDDQEPSDPQLWDVLPESESALPVKSSDARLLARGMRDSGRVAVELVDPDFGERRWLFRFYLLGFVEAWQGSCG